MPDDREAGAVIAKAAFRRFPDGVLRAEPGPEIGLEDVFDGDPAWTPLIRDQDIPPGKRGTDLSNAAIVRSTEGKPRSDWEVEITVPDRLHYQFRVRGPSAWVPRRRGWERTAPELVNEVPLTCGLAFGGDEPGSSGGIRSGVNKGHCRPISNRTPVFVHGAELIQNDNLYDMKCAGPNGPGNTVGRLLFFE